VKIIRIFLLVLIIVGLILIFTQNIWVPKLVDRLTASDKAFVVVPVMQPNLSLKDGRQCYTYNHDATADSPYTVNEFMDITIKGTKVTGTKKGTQDGPDMTNGYTGTIVGTLDKNKITDIFSYTVEGSHNQEKEIYRTNKVGIEKLRYPLIEQSGVLVPDTTQDFSILSYARVGCTASN